ncbi:MAG: GntR family transcriptional regulator [Dehalococcoidia bacterium]|nr:GntR family transcriptional regulator [Dehalococcoidia bacterium]
MGCPPAEADIQSYFKVTPPTVHQVILTLEKRGLIKRVPGQARSIGVTLSLDRLPKLK